MLLDLYNNCNCTMIVGFIKMMDLKKFLILCCYLNDPQLCVGLVIVVHESLVCPEQLNCLLFFR